MKSRIDKTIVIEMTESEAVKLADHIGEIRLALGTGLSPANWAIEGIEKFHDFICKAAKVEKF